MHSTSGPFWGSKKSYECLVADGEDSAAGKFSPILK